MKQIYVLLLCFFAFLNSAKGQTICTDPILQVAIDDTQINEVIASHSASEDVNAFTVTENANVDSTIAKDYFSMATVDGVFTLSTTEKFKNLNSDATPTGTDTLVISLKCTCTSSTQTIIMVTITNTNQNAPTFTKASFKYNVPIPLMPRSDVTVYGDEIVVTDIDFSNTDIIFTIYPDEFTISTTSLGNKQYKAVFSTNSIITLTEPKTYTLTATDSGSPAQSTSVSVILEIDTVTGLDTPSFPSTIYTFNYTKSTGTPSIINTGSDIIVSSNKGLAAKYGWSGDYVDNFVLIFDNSTNTFSVDVNANNALSLAANSPLGFTLSFTTDFTAGAIISITIEKVYPAFTKTVYVGTYSFDTNVITWQDQLSVTGHSSVKLEGDKESLFDFDSSALTITPKSLLSETDFQNSNIRLQVVAESESGYREATVIITAASTNAVATITFAQSYYSGIYTPTDSLDNIYIQGDINLVDTGGATTNIDLTFTGFEDNFKGSCDAATLKCSISLEKNIDSSIVSSSTELLVTVVANSEDATGTTAILFTLPSPDISFSFSQLYYLAEYNIQATDGGLAEITLIDAISISNADPQLISISLSDYSSNFKISYDSSNSIWLLTVEKNLDADVLSNNSALLIELTATENGASESSFASLSIKLPDIVSVAFAQPHYSAVYTINADGKGQIALVDDSAIETTDYTNIVVTLNDYSKYFEIKPDESNKKLTLNVKDPLSSSILTENSELRLLLTITKASVSYGTCSLTISLPGLSFSNTIYSGSYSEDNSVGTVTLDKIELNNADVSLVELTLSDYSDYFELTLDNKQWTLSSSNPLSSEIKEKNDNLPILLTASRTSDKTTLATSTIVITLPVKQNPSIVPEFSRFTFTGIYSIGGDGKGLVTLEQNIGMAQVNTIHDFVISIESEDYSKNFKLTDNGDDTYGVTVVTSLDDDVLNTVTSLVFTLIAETTDGDQGFATLIITLPKRSTTSSVLFKNLLYNADYKDSKVEAKIEITTDLDDADIGFDISDANNLSQYFTKDYSKGTLTIRASSIPDNVVSKYALIALVIKVTDQTTGDTDNAVLNISIDDDDNGDNNGDDDPDHSTMNTGLLVSVIILACLLVSLIVVVIVYWYFKIRNVKYVDLEEEEPETRETKFTKNDTKKRPESFNSASLRRPTGIPIIQTSSILDETDAEIPPVESPDKPKPERSVAFSDNVENIEDEVEEEEKPSDNFLNVAERRPTKFVFANPLEEGVFDSPPQSPKLTVEDERKKSVAFDDNIERMPIETVEAEEEVEADDESENEDSEKPNTDDSNVEEAIKDDVDNGPVIDTTPNVVPSDIFKQIF